MKKVTTCMATAAVVALAGTGTAVAQEDGPPNFVPVELTACTYRDGKDRSDLDDAMQLMTDWMSENDAQPYASWILEKWFTTPSQPFDYLYVGAWPTGAIMGRDMAQYSESAGEAIAAFAEVGDCGANVLNASLMIKSGPENSPADVDGFVLSISDCSVADGRSIGDAMRAMREYAAYRDDNGSPGGTFLWFPAYGGGDADFDFKLVNSHQDYVAFGDHYQWIVDNAAYNKSAELNAGLVDCDEARVYTGDTVVNTFPDN